MARHAAIGHVPARQLEVGAAYPSHPHAHDTLARRGRRIGIVVAHNQFGIEHQGAHRSDSNRKNVGCATGADEVFAARELNLLPELICGRNLAGARQASASRQRTRARSHSEGPRSIDGLKREGREEISFRRPQKHHLAGPARARFKGSITRTSQRMSQKGRFFARTHRKALRKCNSLWKGRKSISRPWPRRHFGRVRSRTIGRVWRARAKSVGRFGFRALFRGG